MAIFTQCSNADCIWACWCKRFTYRNNFPDIMADPDNYPVREFHCKAGEYYQMNVSRKAYERDNNVSIYDEFEQQKHNNNNRKSRVRQNDNSSEESRNLSTPRLRPPANCVPVLLERSSGRSTNESSENSEPTISEDEEQLTELISTYIGELDELIQRHYPAP